MHHSPDYIDVSKASVTYMSDTYDCKCKGELNHYLIIKKGKYKFWPWLGLMTGVSVKPHKVIFRCSKCEKDIAETCDKQAMKNFY